MKDSWVIGNKKDYITAVLCIDYAVVGKWADEKKLNYTSYTELSQKPEVYDLIEKQIRQANKDLPDAAKVAKFTNLYKELDADDDELTRTRKLRRKFVEKDIKTYSMLYILMRIWCISILRLSMKMDARSISRPI